MEPKRWCPSRFFRRFKRKNTRTTTVAIAKRAAATAPAMTAPLALWLDEELSEPLVGDSAPPVLEMDDVADGVAVREVGEVPSRHDLSSETPTRRMSELPPLRPLESVRTKIMLVPAATSAVQSKVVGPVGGLRTNVSPPGIMPYIAQTGVDWSMEGK